MADSAGRNIVAAAAADLQAIVVRDDQGNPHRYAQGDVVAGSEWRVASVVGDAVMFESVRREMGARVEMRVHVGETFRLHAPQAPAALAIPKMHARKVKPAGSGKQ
jgi:hypothetical protein